MNYSDPFTMHCSVAQGNLLMSHVTHTCLLPQLYAALRRCAVGGKGVPVVCGSALRNRGIQPLMDAVTTYLPSPNERAFNQV